MAHGWRTSAPIYTDTLSWTWARSFRRFPGPNVRRIMTVDALTWSVKPRRAFTKEHGAETFQRRKPPMGQVIRSYRSKAKTTRIESGKVVIASITSCTNTSNPYVMIGSRACWLRKRRMNWAWSANHGSRHRWRRDPRLCPQYLDKAAGLQHASGCKIGFNLVGYGCTTCIGNSGPLLQKEIERKPLLRAIWSPHRCPVWQP